MWITAKNSLTVKSFFFSIIMFLCAVSIELESMIVLNSMQEIEKVSALSDISRCKEDYYRTQLGKATLLRSRMINSNNHSNNNINIINQQMIATLDTTRGPTKCSYQQPTSHPIIATFDATTQSSYLLVHGEHRSVHHVTGWRMTRM